MIIKQDPITKLWCREDGAVLMPPCRNIHRFRHEWTFGCPNDKLGHLVIQHRGKLCYVHRMVARAFIENPDNLPTVDHIDRNPANNKVDNLRWADRKMQNNNHGKVLNRTDYGVRLCEDPKAYWFAHGTAYYAAHREELKARQRDYEAAKRAKGLTKRKGPDGKWGWYPRVTPVKEVAPCL